MTKEKTPFEKRMSAPAPFLLTVHTKDGKRIEVPTTPPDESEWDELDDPVVNEQTDPYAMESSPWGVEPEAWDGECDGCGLLCPELTVVDRLDRLSGEHYTESFCRKCLEGDL